MRRLTFVLFAILAPALIAAMLASGCNGGGGKPSPTSRQPRSTVTPTPTSTATETPTATPTQVPTSTPTPVPSTPPASSAGGVARFIIPRFGIDAPIEELGVDANDTMEVPTRDPYRDVGWYDTWTRPGSEGNAVFSAHVYWHSVPGPFNRLSQLAAGDEVDVRMDSGVAYRYTVISNRAYSLSTLNMGNVIWPQDRPPGSQWITMITCAGGTAANGYDYYERNVVIAQRVG